MQERVDAGGQTHVPHDALLLYPELEHVGLIQLPGKQMKTGGLWISICFNSHQSGTISIKMVPRLPLFGDSLKNVIRMKYLTSKCRNKCTLEPLNSRSQSSFIFFSLSVKSKLSFTLIR